jgi:hypothetical protein
VDSVVSLTHQLEHVLMDYRGALEQAEMLQQEIKYHYSWGNIVKALENVYMRDSNRYRGFAIQVTPALKY